MVNVNKKTGSFSIVLFVVGLFVGFLLKLPIFGSIAFFLLFMYFLAKLIDANRWVERANKAALEIPRYGQPFTPYTISYVIGFQKKRLISFFVGIVVMMVFLQMNPYVEFWVLKTVLDLF